MNEPLVIIHDVSKVFTQKHPPAVANIQGIIPKGQIVGLVGPDGSGKTTLIRLIAGLLKPTQGYITVAGYDTIKDAEAVHYLTGYMPQKFGLYEDLTVQENLNLYADLRGVYGKEKISTFDRLLSFTGLAPFTARLASDLSGGMKQKLGLACALVKKPTLLLLDEPSVGVDPISRRELWKMVNDLIAEGISVVWSTAYLDEAEKCHTVLLINDGKLLFNGKPQDLTKNVEGRVFKISNIQGNRRQLLSYMLKQENVIDGLIQGNDLRIVIQKKNTPPFDTHVPLENLHVQPTPPRFEDAFIDLLGGGPKESSELAANTPKIQETSEYIVVAEGLTKKFGSFIAADNIAFSIPQGEIFGLLGPNGAGKSTIFKMLCGLLEPTEGKALVKNFDLQKAPSIARSRIGYMAQKFSLYGSLSVLQNLNFFSGIYNLKGKEQASAVKRMTDIFSLQSYRETSSEELPLGFKQRLSLACANMHHPDVLFLDEPTSGVDPLTRREFWNHINGLVEKGVTIMVTTHFMDEAEYCDRIALIYRGKIIQMATPDKLKDIAKTPQNPSPTLDDAFIKLIEEYDASHPL
ncbi:MAG: ATP-binding cassette domain-containing protein [Parachlamydiaceae bacterium]